MGAKLLSTLRRLALAGIAVLLVGASPSPEGPAWTPDPGASWQWQLSGRLDPRVPAEVYDVDLFTTSPAAVADLHRRGRRAVCYLSAGSFERGRPDAARFPSAVLGRPLQGWPGERWLDVRRLDVLLPILESRLDLCAAKGFDGVELDNVDGYENRSGFPLSGADQRAFNIRLADAARARGLAVGLKNDLGQAAELEPFFDFAVNEECFRYRECAALRPFLAAGKAVFHAEYAAPARRFCPAARRLGLSSIRKRPDLGPWRQACPRAVPRP